MCVCVCVCVCARAHVVCACVCARVHVFVCVGPPIDKVIWAGPKQYVNHNTHLVKLMQLNVPL